MRRRQREAASNQKQEEAQRRQWEAHRSSISSHSSGDEVFLPLWLPLSLTAAWLKNLINVSDCHVLQGEESVLTRLAPPQEMLPHLQAQAPPMKFNENTEGDGQPKTGNTCNALSGKTHHNTTSSSRSSCLHSLSPSYLPQVPCQACPTSLVSGERVGVEVSTKKFPAAAWPPRLLSTRLCTAWADSSVTSWTHA